MVKIIKLSDLHTETFKYKMNINNDMCDIVIFAGDIGNKFQAMKLINELLEKNIIVIYVLGNHEFYNYNNKVKTIDEIKDGWKKRSEENENLHVLDDSSVVIKGIKFIGSTAWTKISTENYDAKTINYEIDCLSDFQKIIKRKLMRGYRTIRGYPITLEDYDNMHIKSINYIKDEIAKPFNGRKILITHHPITKESKHPDFENYDFNSQFFTSDYSEIIHNSDLHYYFHGHIHYYFKYDLNETNVLCNAYGYAKYNEINPLFTTHEVINIDNGY